MAALTSSDAAALGLPLKLLSHVQQAMADARAADAAAAGGGSESEGGWPADESAASSGGGEEGGEQQPAAVEAAVEVPADIMQRRAPPRRRTFARESVRVTKRTQLPPYGLTVRQGSRDARGLLLHALDSAGGWSWLPMAPSALARCQYTSKPHTKPSQRTHKPHTNPTNRKPT